MHVVLIHQKETKIAVIVKIYVNQRLKQTSPTITRLFTYRKKTCPCETVISFVTIPGETVMSVSMSP